MPTTIITGGTGTIGQLLTALLVNMGHEVIILTRHLPNAAKKMEQGVYYALWNIEKGEIDTAAIANADYIIHLAGAGVAEKRWTEARKADILQSRTKSSALLVKALQTTPHKVKAVVSASAIGWYGADTAVQQTQPFHEDWLPAKDFLGETCKLWEASVDPIAAMGIRLVKLRTGIVLSNGGGAFPEFKKTLPMGIASILGSGEQMISWIHEKDVCNMYLFALENEVNGVFNAVAPHPVSNKILTLELATQIRGKAFIAAHVPSFVLKLVLGEMSIEVLKSTTVSAAKVEKAGFIFSFPFIKEAIADLVSK